LSLPASKNYKLHSEKIMTMKNTLLIIIGLLLITIKVSGQQIDISGLYSSSTTKEFKNSWGYDLGYNQFINKNRFGISFRQYFYNNDYDDIYPSTEDGVSKYIKEYNPHNRRIAINLTYSYCLIENEKSNLFLGVSIGLNYFKLNGSYTRIENGNISGGTFSYDYNKNNRIGFGFLIEYELKQIISDRISSSIKINPELTSFDQFGTMGGYSSWMIGWLNFSIGFKYRLTD